MRLTVCITALAATLFATSCASQGPGNGYRVVRVAANSQGSETDSGGGMMKYLGLGGLKIPGISRGEDTSVPELYSGTRRLGTVGEYSISPSGRYALFTESSSLRLFDRDSGQIRDVTDGEFALPWTFTWDEAVGVATVTYYQHHDPSKISLRR